MGLRYIIQCCVSGDLLHNGRTHNTCYSRNISLCRIEPLHTYNVRQTILAWHMYTCSKGIRWFLELESRQYCGHFVFVCCILSVCTKLCGNVSLSLSGEYLNRTQWAFSWVWGGVQQIQLQSFIKVCQDCPLCKTVTCIWLDEGNGRELQPTLSLRHS